MVSFERVGAGVTYFLDRMCRACRPGASRGIGAEERGCKVLVQSFELWIILENGGVAWWKHC